MLPTKDLRRSRRTLRILRGDIPLGQIRTEILGDHRGHHCPQLLGLQEHVHVPVSPLQR